MPSTIIAVVRAFLCFQWVENGYLYRHSSTRPWTPVLSLPLNLKRACFFLYQSVNSVLFARTDLLIRKTLCGRLPRASVSMSYVTFLWIANSHQLIVVVCTHTLPRVQSNFPLAMSTQTMYQDEMRQFQGDL